jgi:signal transduction histidine kinase
MNPFALSGLLTGVASLAMGGFVYAKAPAKTVNRLWLLFTVSVSVWGFGVLWIAQDPNPASSLRIWRHTYAFGVVWIPVLFYHFILHFTEQQSVPKYRKWIIAHYVVAAIFVPFLLFSSSILSGVRPFFDFHYVVGGPLFILYLLWWSGLTLHAHVLVFQGYRHSTGLRQTQFGYTLAAFLLAYGTGSLSYLPALGVDVYPYGNFGIMLYPIIITYAIGAYRLMDIRTVVHKTIAWGVLSCLVVLPIAAILVVAQDWIGGLPPAQQAGVVCALVLLLVPYSQLIQPYVDHLFQRRRNDLQKSLQNLSHVLGQLKNITPLVEAVTASIRNTLYVSQASMFIRDGKNDRFVKVGKGGKEGEELILNQTLHMERRALGWLRHTHEVLVEDNLLHHPNYADYRQSVTAYFRKFDAKIVMQFTHNGRMMGILHLGEKETLKPYTDLELAFLANLRDDVSIALSNSLLYEEVQELSNELQRWAMALESRVEERTRELAKANQELEDSVQKLKTYDAMKETFFTNVNHEMRTPLTMIIAPLEMLASRALGPLTPEQERYAREMQGQARRLLNLVNNILQMAKIDAGTTGFRLKQGDFAQQVQEISDSFVSYAADKSIKLTCERKGDLPAFFFDPVQIELVICNLIFNAIKFTRKGGEVTLSCQTHADGVLVQVQDTGVGIPSADFPHLFRRYFSGTKSSGTGIGLSLAKSIIDLHHGKIWVDTEEGKGTTISFTLPLVSSETD